MQLGGGQRAGGCGCDALAQAGFQHDQHEISCLTSLHMEFLAPQMELARVILREGRAPEPLCLLRALPDINRRIRGEWYDIVDRMQKELLYFNLGKKIADVVTARGKSLGDARASYERHGDLRDVLLPAGVPLSRSAGYLRDDEVHLMPNPATAAQNEDDGDPDAPVHLQDELAYENLDQQFALEYYELVQGADMDELRDSVWKQYGGKVDAFPYSVTYLEFIALMEDVLAACAAHWPLIAARQGDKLPRENYFRIDKRSKTTRIYKDAVQRNYIEQAEFIQSIGEIYLLFYNHLARFPYMFSDKIEGSTPTQIYPPRTSPELLVRARRDAEIVRSHLAAVARRNHQKALQKKLLLAQQKRLRRKMRAGAPAAAAPAAQQAHLPYALDDPQEHSIDDLQISQALDLFNEFGVDASAHLMRGSDDSDSDDSDAEQGYDGGGVGRLGGGADDTATDDGASVGAASAGAPAAPRTDGPQPQQQQRSQQT